MSNVSEAYTIAAGLLNDPSKVEWTDAKMLSRAKMAHIEMQIRLLEFGLPVLKEVSTAITVPVATALLPSQPNDLIEPLFMKEKIKGESDTRFIDMTEVDFIPTIALTSRIRFWAWREEKVQLLKATVECEVQLRYMKGLTTITSGTSSIGLLFGEAFLGPRIAALCYQSVGQIEDATINDANAASQLERILRANVKGMSHKPMRRIPFSVSQARRQQRFTW